MAAFKGNIEFEGSQRSQGFRPINLPDVTDQIRLNAQQFENTLQRHEKATADVRAFNVKMKRGREEQETKIRMEQMAQFSDKLKQGLDVLQKTYEDSRQTEAKMALLDVQTTSEDLERIRLEIASMKGDSDKIDKVKLKNAQKANYEAIAALNNLDNYQKFHAQNSMVQSLGKYVKPWLNQRLATDDSTEIPIGDRVITPMQARSPAEIVAATEVLVRQFHEQTGASFLPDDLYEFSLKPQINQARSDILDKSRVEWSKQLKGDARLKASQTFLADKDLGKWMMSTAHLHENGLEGAWYHNSKVLRNWAKNGQLSGSDIEVIFSGPSSRNPKVMWKDKKERYSLYNELLKLRREYDKEAHKASTHNREMQYLETEERTRQILSDRLAAGNPMTERALTDIEEEMYLSQGLNPSQVISNFRKGFTMDDIVVSDQRRQLNALKQNFSLHETHPVYLNASPQLQNEFAQAAKAGTAMLAMPDNAKQKFDLIPSYVKGLFNLTPYKARTDVHDQVENRLKELFVKIYDKVKDPDEAYRETKRLFLLEQQDPNNRYFRSNSKGEYSATGQFRRIDGDPSDYEAKQQEISRINQGLEKRGLTALPEVISTAEEIKEIAANLTKNGFKLPQKFYDYGAKYNIPPVELFNRAYKFHHPDGKGVQFPKANTDLERGLSSRQIQDIYGPKATQQSRAGAFCTATGAAKWQRPPLPDNLGEHIETAAAKHAAGTGLTPDQLSMLTFAVGDAENRGVWRDHEKSTANAAGYFQIIPETARGMGGDPMNPQSAADMAVRHLADSMRVMTREYPNLSLEERMGLAALAYNAGNSGVIDNKKRIPQYGGSYAGGENRLYLAYVLMAMCRFGGSDVALNHPAMMRMSNFNSGDVEKFRSTFSRYDR